ncbi:MAG TPA: DUF1287 domain-containing protein [Thermoanaerobaculia bacterium]|nr:DUF1287 domain-containing protein [Thermoanaerobaculia bacterium]HQN06489.1 DUF1287 domain-containing protein [Thermoanaerobaculia bacterium]HQP84851.1 DUF1287 domain-containing protein [Thermoanaerobaculia bacterium]
MSLLLLLLLGATPTAPPSTGERLVAAARAQVGVTTSYDGAYRRLAYPAGDVPAQTGVCTDVVVRAYRHLGIDLQVLVHQDMKAAWSAYPKLWRLSRPDPSIDHRRVPNLVTFFRRHGATLPVSRRAAGFSPGDIVVWRLASGVPHIGFVSDRRTPQGTPLVLHNIGSGAREEDVLFSYVITGHFRYPPSA